MKLLFDENVRPKLVGLVDAEFPESPHVYDLGLRGATDGRIWEHARENGFTIVSKDDDFRQRSFVHGAPLKVVWLQVANAGTSPLQALLRTHPSLADALPHFVHHYLADADIRLRDEVYRADQQVQILEVVEALEEGRTLEATSSGAPVRH